jgi:hypothetical protein
MISKVDFILNEKIVTITEAGRIIPSCDEMNSVQNIVARSLPLKALMIEHLLGNFY